MPQFTYITQRKTETRKLKTFSHKVNVKNASYVPEWMLLNGKLGDCDGSWSLKSK